MKFTSVRDHIVDGMDKMKEDNAVEVWIFVFFFLFFSETSFVARYLV